MAFAGENWLSPTVGFGRAWDGSPVDHATGTTDRNVQVIAEFVSLLHLNIGHNR